MDFLKQWEDTLVRFTVNTPKYFKVHDVWDNERRKRQTIRVLCLLHDYYWWHSVIQWRKRCPKFLLCVCVCAHKQVYAAIGSMGVIMH